MPPPSQSAAAGERLALLAADHLVLVPDALALVRLRLAGRPHLGGELPDLLLVGALDHDRRRVGHVAGHPVGRRQLDRVGVADRQDDLVLVLAGLVADALDLQPLLEAVGHALDHVVDQAAGQAVQRPALPFVVAAGDVDDLLARVVLDGDLLAERRLQLALGAFDAHGAVLDLHLDGGGDDDGLFSDPGHGWTPTGRGALHAPYRSPHGANDLAADLLGAGLAVAHQPLARAQHGDA